MYEERQKSLHWEEFKNEIIDTENFTFFKGSKRFLFKNERGEYDWSSFSDKFAVAKKIVTDNGLTYIGKGARRTTPKEVWRTAFSSHIANHGIRKYVRNIYSVRTKIHGVDY